MAYGEHKNGDQVAKLQQELSIAETKAWSALAGYKFMMFGYWAAIWVHINRMGGFQRPNPFKPLVDVAKAVYDEKLSNNSVLQALAQRGEPK